MLSQPFSLQRSPATNKKNNLIRLLLLWTLAFLFFISLSCTRYEVKNIHSRGKEIICFGDSITAGAGVSEKENYPYFLSELLDYSVINAGRDGETSSDGLRRLDKDVLSYQPRLVIIEFGGNDFLRKLPLTQTINNIRIMTERIQAGGAMVAIADVSSSIAMKTYRDSYKKLAYQTQAIFIPSLLQEIITNPSLKSDYIHPNAKGNQLIAKGIYQAIRPFLKQNNLRQHAGNPGFND
ncbi:MAG: arylesterase [Candidatus Omnitrophica bacterium]|nr:arylesterase [Candidatus Omnitrophota bacterium]